MVEEDGNKENGGEGEGQSFEEAYAAVEEIIRELESGDLTLKESIQKYERAAKAVDRCYELLDKAQKKIEVLIKDAEGRITGRRDFESE